MESFKEFLEIFKLPPSILSAISIVTGIILFLPDNVIKIFYLIELKSKYGNFIGMLFIISVTMLTVLLIMWSAKKIIKKYKIRRLRKLRIKYLIDFDGNKTKLIKRFIKERDHTLELATNNGVTVELNCNQVIAPAGNTQLFSFGNVLYGDENTVYIKYFLQPWVINLIEKEELLRKKFYE